MGVDNNDAALGFGLVCFAGGCTGLGAAIVFSKRLVALANKRFLAAALGVAAGVMIYVSLIEIFVKAQGAFEDAGHSESMAYFYATLCFFLGVLFNFVLDKFVHYLENSGVPMPSHYEETLPGRHGAERRQEDIENLTVDMSYVDPKLVDEVVHELDDPDAAPLTDDVRSAAGAAAAGEAEAQPAGDEVEAAEYDLQLRRSRSADEESEAPAGAGKTADDEKLERMGMMTAIAIGLHNFPEGLATFVATLDDPAVGISLAIAIAIHNVPEGICVAVPIYYASGSRCKAFAWAALSGVSEIIGAALGWAIFATNFDDNAYGVLFGLVAGIMVHIVLHELIPTALRYDPEDTVVTHTVFAGAAVMALSLVLFVVA
eukprot:CAMPEP_0118851592 /NCGR_PEP_ID=MMETSP1163-20130328/985_1 /TAXON_ID=124430 /ORGANISM="Phaeomonas parva, Strain CCMP2877" /LENGTH=372 /DNA_ID=CAMNT_0006783963 /DNA_START=146 /DNA_END=1264 /DNA_ORIENTATION=+